MCQALTTVHDPERPDAGVLWCPVIGSCISEDMVKFPHIFPVVLSPSVMPMILRELHKTNCTRSEAPIPIDHKSRFLDTNDIFIVYHYEAALHDSVIDR